MNKKLFIALVLWCASLSAFSLGLVKGKVYDENSGQALPGATIYIHEFERGVVTDENGFFILNEIPLTEINIEVSFLGYETKIIRTNQNDELKIGLKPSMIETAEVVISASNFSSQHELQVVNAFAQNRPSEFETLTAAYRLINAGAGSNLSLGKQTLIVSLNANNLFNKIYFDHLSTLKEIGFYNPGRNIALNLQWKF